MPTPAFKRDAGFQALPSLGAHLETPRKGLGFQDKPSSFRKTGCRGGQCYNQVKEMGQTYEGEAH